MLLSSPNSSQSSYNPVRNYEETVVKEKIDKSKFLREGMSNVEWSDPSGTKRFQIVESLSAMFPIQKPFSLGSGSQPMRGKPRTLFMPSRTGG